MKKKIILIGGFRETKILAQSLLKKGYRVIAINEDRQSCLALAEIDKLKVYHGDGSKPFVLDEANVYGADIAIALTERDDDNLVICQLCKKKFNIKKTVTLISDPKKTEFFYSLGIDSVVCAISAITGIIEQQAFMDDFITYLPIDGGRIKIVQIPIAADAPAVGKRMMELSLPKEVIIGCILRGDSNIVPRGNTQILGGDILLMISADKYEAEAVRELTGK